MASGPLHARDFSKRQDLSGLISGIFSGESQSFPGLGNDVSGLLPSRTIIILTSSSAISTDLITSLVPSAIPTSSSLSLSPLSLPSPSPSTVLALTTSSVSTPPASTASDPITSPPAPVSTATPEDNTLTITSTSTISSSTVSAAPASTTPKSFFQNKPLEGGVFAAIGIVALIVIVTIATMALRKSRRNRFDKKYADAVTFDPVETTPHTSDVEKASDDTIARYASTGRPSGPPGHGAGYGGGDYQVFTLPNSGQTSLQTYHGQQQGVAFGYTGARPPLGLSSQPRFGPTSPVSQNPIFNPDTSAYTKPVLELHIPKTRSNARSENARMPLFFDAKPSSPSERYLLNGASSVSPSDESSADATSDSHSRALDPNLGRVPVASPLPPSFGDSRLESLTSVNDMRYIPGGLKIANA